MKIEYMQWPWCDDAVRLGDEHRDKAILVELDLLPAMRRALMADGAGVSFLDMRYLVNMDDGSEVVAVEIIGDSLDRDDAFEVDVTGMGAWNLWKAVTAAVDDALARGERGVA